VRLIVSQLVEEQIAELENRLRNAMLNGMVADLDELLAPDLIFTNHLGRLLGKQDDLNAYRSEALNITELSPSEQQVRKAGDVVVVSVRMQLRGTYGGEPASGDFRFTRVWAPSPKNAWHVVAAHAGLVV
jgi:ketosteroid isomerase-like protein